MAADSLIVDKPQPQAAERLRGHSGHAAAEPEGRGRLSSVAMAVRLMKAFSDGEAEIGVSALAARLGIAKSTVHRLASTLVAEGMLEQNPETGRYRLGIALFGLGALVRRRMNLSTEAKPFLFELRERTNETVLLAIPADGEVMYVYNLESTQAIRMRSDIGVRQPAWCTAVGRAIFAFKAEAAIARLVSGPLAPRTPRTLTDPVALRAALAEVRRLGYAIEDEESEAGMRCVAAPVRDASGEVVAAVGVAGPVQRLSLERLAEIAAPVTETAAAIAARLGYQPGAIYQDERG
jgi:IclR family transcriptional regulator, KDG regulon repressor